MDNEYLKRIYGLLESGATLGTGAVSGLVGLPYGLYKGVTSGSYGTPEAPRIAAREAQQFMERNTYQPRSAEGQENLRQIAGLLEASKLPPVMPEASLLAAIPKQAYAAQAERAGMAAERAIAPVVTRTMERGGLPAQLLGDLAQGSRRQIFVPATKEEASLASKMISDGKSKKEVWQDIGVAKGVDGEWKKEISDFASSMKGGNTYGETIMNAYIKGAEKTGDQLYATNVNDVFFHPELAKMYPDLMEMETQLMPSSKTARGAMSKYGDKTMIHVREDLPSNDARSTMLHELQHAIQEKEGFGVGGNVDAMDRLIADAKFKAYMIKESDEYKLADKELTKLYDDFFQGKINKEQFKTKSDDVLKKNPIINEYRTANDEIFNLGKEPTEAYRRLMGEAESRLTQRRMDLTPEQRLENYPFEYTGQSGYGFDVEPKKMIHMNRSGNIIERGLLD